MATSDSREVVIEATPEEILDVIADSRRCPSGLREQAGISEILEGGDDGRPRRVKMKVKAAGHLRRTSRGLHLDR